MVVFEGERERRLAGSDDGVEPGQSRAAHRRRAMRLVERRVVEECHSGRGEDEVCG